MGGPQDLKTTSKKRRADELRRLYLHAGHFIRRCQQIHVALFLHECAELNLTPVQYAILFSLSQADGVDQATIAGYVALDRSTTGNVLMRLEKRGLLKREASAEDGRVKVLHLTAKGRKLVAEARDAVIRVQKELLKPLDTEEKVLFERCLRKIAEYHNTNSRAPLLTSLLPGSADE
jgi:DNA-binding MarR family transcriptional regulator